MELSQLQMMLKGCDIAACFVGAAGRADLKWSLQKIANLPEEVIPDLYRQYLKKRKAGKEHNAKAANTWLRERTEWLKKLLRSFPVHISDLRNEERRAMVATEWANQTAQILSNETNGHTEQCDARQLFRLVSEPAAMWGFVPAMPDFETEEAMHNWMSKILGAVDLL